MKDVLKFIWENRFIIMVIVWAITYAITNWTGFKADVNKYMLAAKQMSKDGILKSGKEQEEWVVNMVLQRLPKTWVDFLSEETKRNIIKKLYEAALDIMDDGKLNKSI